MRKPLLLALLYVLFIVQAMLSPWGPDLLLIVVLVLAIHEDRLTVVLLAFFSGLCLDLLSPASIGAGILVFVGLAYGATSLRTVVYRARWYVAALVLTGFLLKQLVFGLAGGGAPGFLPLLVSGLLTVVLAVPAELAAVRLFYPAWKQSSSG